MGHCGRDLGRESDKLSLSDSGSDKGLHSKEKREKSRFETEVEQEYLPD